MTGSIILLVVLGAAIVLLVNGNAWLERRRERAAWDAEIRQVLASIGTEHRLPDVRDQVRHPMWDQARRDE